MDLELEYKKLIDEERKHRQKIDRNIKFYHPTLLSYDVKYRNPNSLAHGTLSPDFVPEPSHKLREQLKKPKTDVPDEPDVPDDIDDIRKEFYENLSNPPTTDKDKESIVPLKHHQVIYGSSKPRKATISKLTDDQLKRARLVEASKISYQEGNEKAQKYLNENNMSDYKINKELSNANQAGLVVENPKGNVEIAYRGTDVRNINDLIDDAKILTGREKHAIAEQQVKTIQSEGYNVEHISGFSLGGNKAINISSQFDIPSTSFNSGIGPKILNKKLNNKHTLIKTTEDPVSILGEIPKSNFNVEYIEPLKDSLNPIESHKLINFTDEGTRRADKRFQLQHNIDNAKSVTEVTDAITEYNNYNKYHTQTQGKYTKNKFIKTIHPTTTLRALGASALASKITEGMDDGLLKTATTGAVQATLVATPKTLKQLSVGGALGAVVDEKTQEALTKDLQYDTTISKKHKKYVTSALGGAAGGATAELAFLALSGEEGAAALVAAPEAIPIAIAVGAGLGLISAAFQDTKVKKEKSKAPPPRVVKPTFIPR